MADNIRERLCVHVLCAIRTTFCQPKAGVSHGGRPVRSVPVPLPPFQRLVDEHGEDVFRFLVATAGVQDADDCWQETYLAAMRAYPGIRSGSNLRAWLFTIAHNKAMDTHRARSRHAVPVGALPERGEEPAGPPVPELWHAVDGLPAKQREAVLRRYVADLPYADIGMAMGTSSDAARRNVFEGIRKLREVWDEQ
jgi:DNA-directed RNA polymerase specialized sigma24 family protein